MSTIPDDVWKSGIAFTGDPKQRIAYMEGMIAERDRLGKRVEQLEKEMAVLKAIVARQLSGEDIDA